MSRGDRSVFTAVVLSANIFSTKHVTYEKNTFWVKKESYNIKITFIFVVILVIGTT